MVTWKTTAAARFIEDVKVGWDSFEPWEATAENGLADVDEDALRSFCDENDEDYSTAEEEVLEYIRAKVASQKQRTCAKCGKQGIVADDQTDPNSDELALDSRGLVARNEYVCGECLERAEDGDNEDGLVECQACGEMVHPEDLANPGQAHDLSDQSRHNTGGERQCLECHLSLMGSDSDLDCCGCEE